MQVIRYFPIAFPSQQPTVPLHRVPAKAVLDIIHDLVQPDLLPALLTIEQKPLLQRRAVNSTSTRSQQSDGPRIATDTGITRPHRPFTQAPGVMSRVTGAHVR